MIANHGIPSRLVEETFAAAAQFFARPEADKLMLRIGQYNIGYLPFGGQVVRHSPVNRNTKPNFSESFYITRDRAPDHPDVVNRKRLVGLNRWPPNMPEFRPATTAYYAAMEAMTTRLVPVVAMALHHPVDDFDGVIHRSVTPDAILVRPDGNPLFLQWEWARISEGQTISGPSTRTPASDYAAPEILAQGLGAADRSTRGSAPYRTSAFDIGVLNQSKNCAVELA